MMLAIALSAGISSVLSADTIYTLKLRRRGIDIRRGRGANLMELLSVEDAMRPVPAPLASEASLGEVIDRFADEGVDALPVVTGERYVGIVPSDQLEDAVRANAFDSTAADLVQEVAPVQPADTLERALEHLVLADASAVAVVDPEGGRLTGWLTHRDILAAYAARLRGAPADESERQPPAGPGTRASLAWLGNYRIVDVELPASLTGVGQQLGAMSWPALTMPIAIRRGEERFVPTDAFILRAGDRVTALVSRERGEDVGDWFGGSAPDRREDNVRADG
jgi:CIC family chloride channel protein